MIKKLNYWVLVALFLCNACVFTSCSSDNDEQVSPQKEQTAKRDRARYTVMIYGNAGGQMDKYIEGVWDEIKPMLSKRELFDKLSKESQAIDLLRKQLELELT